MTPEDELPHEGDAPTGEGPEEPLSLEEQARLAFLAWLQREATGGFGPEERRAFLADLPEPLRTPLRQMLADLDLVRRRRQHAVPEPGLLLEHYRLVERLGEGGAGSVWRATDERLQREVAVKLLHPQLAMSEVQLERFEREARLASSVEHPNLLQVHDVGESQGLHYLVTELVPGGRTLADQIEEARRAGSDSNHPRSMAELFVGICRGMEAVHLAGITHRDLKPNNILLRRDGTPLVADFGLAAVLDEDSLGHTTTRMGTPFYQAPEQITGRAPVGARSDVFALGVSLYEALALQRPFEGDTSHLVGQRIVAEEPDAPRRVRPGTPRDLEAICLAALNKTPGRRYADAGRMADDLERFLAHELILVRRDGPPRRLYKWVRRHPVGASLVAAVLVLLSLGGVFSLETLRLGGELEARNRSLGRGLGALREMVSYMDLEHLRARGEEDPVFLTKLEQEARIGMSGSPRELGELLVTLARVADDLGRPLHGLELFEEAVSLLDSVPDAGRPAASARLRWASMLLRELRPGEAVEVLEPLLGRLDPEQEPVLFARALTRVHAGLGLLEESEAILELEERHGSLEPALERARRFLSATPAGRAVEPGAEFDLERWALEALFRKGEWPQVLEQAERAMTLHTSRLGPRHPRSIEVGILACRVWKTAGMLSLDPDRSLRMRWLTLSEQLAAAAARRLGPRTSLALQAVRVRAEACLQMNRTEEALFLYEDLSRGYEQRMGPDSARLLEVQVALNLARIWTGDAFLAARDLEENLRRREAIGLEDAEANRIARRAWLEALCLAEPERFIVEIERAYEDFSHPEAAYDRSLLATRYSTPSFQHLLLRRPEIDSFTFSSTIERVACKELAEHPEETHSSAPFLGLAYLASQRAEHQVAGEWMEFALDLVAHPSTAPESELSYLLVLGDLDGRLVQHLRSRPEASARTLPLLVETDRELLPVGFQGILLQEAAMAWIARGGPAAREVLELLGPDPVLAARGCIDCERLGPRRECGDCLRALAAHLLRGLPEPLLGDGQRAFLEEICASHEECTGVPRTVRELWGVLGVRSRMEETGRPEGAHR